jgi:hypothetical protein
VTFVNPKKEPIFNCCPQPIQARGFRQIKPLVISGKLSKISKLEIKILRQARGFDIKLKKKLEKHRKDVIYISNLIRLILIVRINKFYVVSIIKIKRLR